MNQINWTKIIDINKKSVLSFATGKKTSTEFKKDFVGIPGTANAVVSQHGTQYGRRLARKALRRRGLLV